MSNETSTQHFTELVTALRKARGFDQKQLAKWLGLSQQYVSDLQTGRRLPSLNVVEIICRRSECLPQGRLVWHRAAAMAHGWKI